MTAFITGLQLTKTYVVGSQKNHLNQRVVLSVPKTYVRNDLQLYTENFCLSKYCASYEI